MNTIIMKENFPVEGEAYHVGEQNGRYFFAWGLEYPFAEEMPEEDISDGASGIEWFRTEKGALEYYLDAVEAVHDTMGSPLMKVMTSREAEEKWGMKSGVVRQSILRGPLKRHIADGHVRKSSGTWLVTKEIMYEVYGDPDEK